VDLPLERMLRDARINQIGEGANEVLTSFIALVGMRGPGMEFKEIYDTVMRPSRDRMSKAWAAGKSRLGATIRVPDVPVQGEELRGHARQLGRLIWRFNFAVNRALITYREPILDMQLVQERIANAAMDLFASTCVISRQDSEIQFARRNGDAASRNRAAADLFLRQSFRRVRGFLAGLTDNDDKAVLAAAKACLARSPG
ncbi:MAG TPA: acyl-CoA dehydrogenase family protein, partial [Candidatus Udaeobacter sp.]